MSVNSVSATDYDTPVTSFFAFTRRKFMCSQCAEPIQVFVTILLNIRDKLLLNR